MSISPLQFGPNSNYLLTFSDLRKLFHPTLEVRLGLFSKLLMVNDDHILLWTPDHKTHNKYAKEAKNFGVHQHVTGQHITSRNSIPWVHLQCLVSKLLPTWWSCLPPVSLTFIQIRFVHLTDLEKNKNCLHVSRGGPALVWGLGFPYEN
jgi:hypothetical protein